MSIFANTPRNGYVPNLGKYEPRQIDCNIVIMYARQMSLPHEQKSDQKLQVASVFVRLQTHSEVGACPISPI